MVCMDVEMLIGHVAFLGNAEGNTNFCCLSKQLMGEVCLFLPTIY